MKSRTLVVGDMHGALKAVEQVLARAAVQATDKLVFLGDYVDGWSQSAQLIEYLMKLEQTHSCIFIKGNHDVWCEDWLRGGEPDKTWLFHGGKMTIESYTGMDKTSRQRHLEFFQRLNNYYVDAESRLFIHAGFASMHGPAHEPYQSNYSWDRTLWEMARTMDTRIRKDSLLYPKRLLLFKEIYIGHTPTLYYDEYTPMQRCNVWNMDTGAAFHGMLSAMDIDTRQVWQSDTVQQLYPSEKGRNK